MSHAGLTIQFNVLVVGYGEEFILTHPSSTSVCK